MLNVKLELAESMDIKSRDRVVTLDIAQVPEQVLVYAVMHGLKQKVADAASGAARDACGITWDNMNRADRKAWVEANQKKIGDVAVELMEAARDRLYDGDWQAERSGGGRAPTDPIGALAVKNAKTALLAIFKQVTDATKIMDMVGNEKVAQFFIVQDDKAVWNEPVVAQWIEKQAEAGKRDFMAEAKATIEGVDTGSLDL